MEQNVNFYLTFIVAKLQRMSTEVEQEPLSNNCCYFQFTEYFKLKNFRVCFNSAYSGHTKI